MASMTRHSESLSLTLDSQIADTPEIPIADYASGEIFIPTGSTITSLPYHVAPAKGGTYLPAQDTSGSAVTQTVAATKAYPLPAVLFGARAMKIVTNADGAVILNLKG